MATKNIKLFVFVCTVASTIGCSNQGHVGGKNSDPPSAEVQRIVEEAAIRHVMKGTKIRRHELKIKSTEKKEGYWQVMVSQSPEVPCGNVLLSVSDDGRVEDYFTKEVTRILIRNIDQVSEERINDSKEL